MKRFRNDPTLAVALWLFGASACSARIESRGLAQDQPGSPTVNLGAGATATDASPNDPSFPERARDAGPTGGDVAGGGSNANVGAPGTAPQPSPVDAGVTPPPAAATDALPDDTTCGAPPYQAIRLGARDIMDPTTQIDPAGVKVTIKHCPDKTFSMKRTGITVLVTTGIETWIRFDTPGFIPWVEGELRVPAGPATPYVEATLVPLAFFQSVVPAWKAHAPLIYVDVRLGRSVGSEACRSPAGVTLAVKDHPQTTVLYRGKGANGGYQDALMTSDEGIAVIANLPATATSVELMATKPGCLYQTAIGDANAVELVPLVRAPLFPGAVTHQVVNPSR